MFLKPKYNIFLGVKRYQSIFIKSCNSDVGNSEQKSFGMQYMQNIYVKIQIYLGLLKKVKHYL